MTVSIVPNSLDSGYSPKTQQRGNVPARARDFYLTCVLVIPEVLLYIYTGDYYIYVLVLLLYMWTGDAGQYFCTYVLVMPEEAYIETAPISC